MFCDFQILVLATSPLLAKFGSYKLILWSFYVKVRPENIFFLCQNNLISVQLDISWVSKANEWDIEFNPWLYKLYVYYVNILIYQQEKADLIHVLRRECIVIHSGCWIEGVTCQQLIGYLKDTWKIVVIFHVWWYLFLSCRKLYKALQFV